MALICSLLVALCSLLPVPAYAQQPTSAGGTIATVTPAVDLSRLPVNVGRIGRKLREAEVREEREGLRLRYTIDVFGEAPKLKLITPLDNLLTGDVPHSAPTHNDMIRMMTPKEFSAPVINLGTVPRRK
jgi:hypothetical protein